MSSNPRLAQKQTKESLILLLYCSMNISLGLEVNIDFALPHAVNLAEAGQTVQNKRTGMSSQESASLITPTDNFRLYVLLRVDAKRT